MADEITPHSDIGGYVLGLLEPEEVAAFEAHLAGCEQCQQELEELSGLPGLLEQAAPPIEVPPDLIEKTFAAIERAAAQDVPQRAENIARRDRRGHHTRRVIELRKVLAVAAAVVVLGVGATVIRETSRPGTAVAETIELTDPGGGSARATAKIRKTATGGVIDMDVEGLPPAPPGSFFECWLVAAAGDSPEKPNRISVGTFTVGEDGRASVQWDFTADIAKFPRMGITLEPDDGNPAQTTTRVLAGTRPLSPLRS